MKTTVERIDDTTVKLQVTVDAARVDEAIDAAAQEVAQEVKVPGFRPGKAPRKVLERRVGKEALLSEAARHSLPAFYREAVEGEDIQVVGQPEFDVETFEDGKDATFTAQVEVRPDVEIPDYVGLQIPHPDWEVTDGEVDEQVEALRERFAELETVERPAQIGDQVVVSVTAARGGEVLEDVSEEDVLYEVHDPEESDQELDRQIIGAKAGDIVKFTDALGPDYGELAGEEVEVSAIVKEVKAKRLPELDDDFAITASEFDTFEELREAMADQLRSEKIGQARAALRGEVVEKVADLVDVPLPQSMVSQEVEFRASQISQQAEQYGLDFEQFLQMTGQTTEDLVNQLKAQAEETVKSQLVIDAIGREAGIQVGQDDLNVEIHRQAERLQRPAAELAELMSQPERLPALVADTFRRKSIDHITEQVEVLSAPPEPAEPEPTEEASETSSPDQDESEDA